MTDAMSVMDKSLPGSIALDQPLMTALRALFLVAAHHGVVLAPDDLPLLTEGDVIPPLLQALDRKGFRARLWQGKTDWTRASRLGQAYPALAETSGGRWVVLVHAIEREGARMAAILDPVAEAEGVKLVPWEEFTARWTGRLILVAKGSALAAERQKFGLRWFLPAILREKSILAGVGTAVVMGNLIAFSLPLLLQTIIDRVIANHAWNTLFAVTAVYVLLVLFDAGFTYVRQRLMIIAGGRIDGWAGARSFAHLLSLPLTVFETTASGVLARHMQQTEKIRHFLTGRLFQTLLDAALLPVLITILALLSGMLTLVVMGFALAIALCIGAMMPVVQRRLNALYGVEAERQALLVETLHNMRAVKALVLEPRRRSLWEDSLAQSVRKQWDVGEIGALAGAITGLLERLMQVAIVALGAGLVLSGAISTGTLIAFLMLAGRVTGPLVQIVGLINEWQEAALSIQMLRHVMDHPPESGITARPMRPQITGALTLDAVGYRYPGAQTPALQDLSLQILPGQMIGIVGRSGSGKTTLTRLIQGIEAPQSGAILVDGTDIRHIDLAHLRGHMGVVLQENLLFRGTIRENISAARPGAPDEFLHRLAELAGASEFIARLPGGLDTVIEEGGANLSGGQRQRIAIARALLTDPRILILDEATSALDPESEALVNRNLSAIGRGRTVIVVSHRLSSLVRADAILVLDQGRLVDMAPHATLIARCEIYRQLWQQQTEHMA